MDLVYGEPSSRLKRAIEEIKQLDPGPPVRLVLQGTAVPDCWLIPKVGKVFFQNRLRCEVAKGRPKVAIFRDFDGSLKRMLTPPEEATSPLEEPL